MKHLLIALTIGLLATPAYSSDCTGDPGCLIGVSSQLGIGEDFSIQLIAPPGAPVLFMASAGQGPTNTPFGTLCLDFPLILQALFRSPPSGLVSIPCHVPCDPQAVGFTGYLQFSAIDPANPSQTKSSNQVAVTIVDNGSCNACDGSCKPAKIKMIYTGSDCSATSHSQDPSKVSCSGDAMGAAAVRILVQDKSDPSASDAEVYFDNLVSLGDSFEISAANAGKTRLRSTTYVFLFDPTGILLQQIMFHTSCSQPLNLGDHFGATRITAIGCEGDDDLCSGGCKPQILDMTYTGGDCSGTSHGQDASKVSCSGDPAFAPQVRILVHDKSNPDDSSAKIWFDGVVDLGGTFSVDSLNGGDDHLKKETHIFICDLGDNLLQAVEFHTSCSQPLQAGDQFGGVRLDGVRCEGAGGGSGLSCADGKPQGLTMLYTGADCSATSHGQAAGKVNCGGDSGMATPVRILAQDRDNPNDSSAKIWFDGYVGLNSTFVIDALNGGSTRLSTETHVFIYSVGGTLLQSVEFHTSCSQPLMVGDRFGSLDLVAYRPE